MKRIYLFSIICIIGLATVSCGTLLNIMTEGVDLKLSKSFPVSHQKWTKLLQKHVRSGKLDYQGIIQDSIIFNSYLTELSDALPNDTNWSRNEQFAYWINAYNAFTVKLIIDHYPVKSIKDIKGGLAFVNSVWDIKFINIQGQEFDLNNIEHGILRDKFKDPRIHFAINCASISCPALHHEAYTAENIDKQLDLVTRAFLQDESKNVIKLGEAKVSKIFKWFKKDFTKDQSLKTFLNKYLESPISSSTKISYTDYDWNLNDISD